MDLIYLDHNATTPLLPEAEAAMRPFAAEVFGNPSSSHQAGRKARQWLEASRETIAEHLGAATDEVTFTSGATEANNLALFQRLGEPPGHVLASRIEHPCVIEPLKQLESRGFTVEWLPVSPEGIIQTQDVRTRIRESTRFVAVMLANHETGAIQPVREIAKSLPPHAAFHCDAVQAVGKIPVNFRELGVTSLSVSAHKFRGPKSVGVLVRRKDVPLKPQLFGGHQQGGRRPGTEPVALAVGMAAALEFAVRNLDANRQSLDSLRSRLWEGLQSTAAPVHLNGPPLDSPRSLPTTLNVSFPGCRGDVLLMALDLAGVACSTGSACSSGSLLPSPVLAAMGVPDEILRSAIRFSLGPTLTVIEIDDAIRRIAECVKRVRGSVKSG
jgi:cysteine desulfurase